MFSYFWVFWKHHFLSKGCYRYFLGNIRKKLGYLFIPVSGHTAYDGHLLAVGWGEGLGKSSDSQYGQSGRV